MPAFNEDNFAKGLVDESLLLPPFRVIARQEQGAVPHYMFFESPVAAFNFANHRKGLGNDVLVSEYRAGVGWVNLATANDAEWLDRPDNNTILDEAKRITSGDRRAVYGKADQDFSRAAKIWEAILSTCLCDSELHITPRHVALCMIGIKLSRETHQHKRDNWVDIAGYARYGQDCADCEQEQAEAELTTSRNMGPD